MNPQTGQEEIQWYLKTYLDTLGSNGNRGADDAEENCGFAQV